MRRPVECTVGAIQRLGSLVGTTVYRLSVAAWSSGKATGGTTGVSALRFNHRGLPNVAAPKWDPVGLKQLGHLSVFVLELFLLADYLYIRLLGPEYTPFEFLGVLVLPLSMGSERTC